MNLTPFEIKVLRATPRFHNMTVPPSVIGQRVWGDKRKHGGYYSAQGLARMAGKFIHRLEKKKLIYWTVRRGYFYPVRSFKGNELLEELGKS